VNLDHLEAVTKGDHMRIHHGKDVCINGHSRVENRTKSGNCKTCMKEYLIHYRAARRAA
jgi:hypothetical protein